jgi:hypothetical protein
MFALETSGCDKQQQQTVSITLTRDTHPLAGVDVRLYAEQDCKGTFQSGKTSDEGQVRFTRNVEIGGVGVITDELSVCINSSGEWRPLFSSLHGPAPALLELKCTMDTPPGSCASSFDGQPFEEPNTDGHDA